MNLYYGRISGNSARALFGLFESGVPFEPKPDPNIAAWIARLAARPAWQKTAALAGVPV